MSDLKISIVIPTLNQGHYIEQTLVSIFNQNYPALELIVIDGGSNDSTVQILNQYDKYITYWVSEPDCGQAHAINKGLVKATGDIFNWINSDDFLEPGALKAIATAFKAQPNKKIMCGYTHCFYDDTGITSHTYRMGIKSSVSETILDVEMNQPGSFYSMEAIRSLGTINPTLRYVFDDELWFRFLCKFGLESVGFTNELIAHFRLHQNSKSVGDGFYEFYKELLNLYLFVAREAGLSNPIISNLEKDQFINLYVSHNDWDFAFLERDKLYKLLADRFMFRLYKDQAYKDARVGLIHSFINNDFKKLDKKIALAMKLLFPNRFIDLTRLIFREMRCKLK